MRIRSLLALLALVPACFLLPAAADSSVGLVPAAMQQKSISPEACLANAKGMHLAQFQTKCCKDHKGICGCRAGKIVCCDTSTSNEPGCMCHGDEGVPE
ncbi:MAG: hypothetical protein ACSLEZ_02180 [Thiobacillus sp.]